MRPKRPSIERRASLNHVVVERTPRFGSRPGKIVFGLAISIGLIYVVASAIPYGVKSLLFDQDPDSPVAQISNSPSDSPRQSSPAADRLSSLYGAVVNADLPTVNSELQHLSREELNRPLNGMTLLMTAASAGNAKILQALLTQGADPNARGAHQRTALQYAAEKNRVQAARLLLDAGADINGADNGSLTPLIMAADRNFTKLALLLIERGANVNIQNVQGWTALMDAAEVGNLQLVKALLAAGARTEARHRNGSMALDFARRGKHQDVMQMLSGNLPATNEARSLTDRNRRAMPNKKGERQ